MAFYKAIRNYVFLQKYINDKVSKQTIYCNFFHCRKTKTNSSNWEKFVFFKDRVEYLGFQFDHKGMHPLRSKVKAVLDAPRPTNQASLQAFLGLISFYECFLPKRATIAQPLYDLLKKDTSFVWSSVHDNAFMELKKLCSEKVLMKYDERLPLLLSCNASSVGIGAVLLHLVNRKEMPIVYTSKTLRSAERNYA